MGKLYLDTETVGLNGPCKLIQYSHDRKPVEFIKLYKGWEKDCAVQAALGHLAVHLGSPNTTLVGFNLSFDLYHLYRTFHHATGLPLDSSSRPIPPFACKTLDLFNHCVLSGPFAPWAFSKKTGKRVVLIRKVPAVAVPAVVQEVERRISAHLPAGVKLSRSQHAVKGRKDLVTLSWVASASLGLKPHAEHFGAEKVQHIADVWPLPDFKEATWLPYPEGPYEEVEEKCEAVMRDESSPFYQYAKDDIHYLWRVEDGLGCPAQSHHDAAVAAIAYTRYYGFPLRRNVLEQTRNVYQDRVRESESLLRGINLRSSTQRLAALRQYEPWVQSSGKPILKAFSREESEVGKIARAMLDYGPSKQRLDQVNKLLSCRTGRAHPDLRTMGTATGRMAGTAGFNYQGIAPAEVVDGEQVGVRAALESPFGGDFSSFEVAIAASAWRDERLLNDLDTGADVHLAVACESHPALVDSGVVYEHADKSDPLVKKCRSEMKRVVFGLLYGAGPVKIEEVLGLSPGEGQKVMDRFFGRFSGAGLFRKNEERRFCTADTERWAGDSVSKMDTCASDLTGWTRHFDFEGRVASALWQLGQTGIPNLPSGTILRSSEKGEQTIPGAVRSACLGGALNIQQAVCRAAINTPIQATGANLTKILGQMLWEDLHTPYLNIHDELIFAAHPNLDIDRVKSIVAAFEAKYRPVVKHIKFDAKEMKVWADK